MSKRIIALFLLMTSLTVFADDKSIYLDLLDNNKLEELHSHITRWEEKEPENPEMFIAYFNYYLRKGYSSGVQLNTQPPVEGQHLAITDPDTGEIVGYMYDSTSYNPEDLAMALIYLNKGLKLSPDRLDMHFGKIHILQQVQDYENQSAALIDALKQSMENNNKWYWSDNEELKDGAEFFLGNIQDYYNTWLKVRSESSLTAVKEAGIIQIQFYPNHVYGYNNVAYGHLIKGELTEALEYLLAAEKIDGDDAIVINNIALCYKNLNETEKAKTYFNKLYNYPEQVDEAYVDNMLEQLD